MNELQLATTGYFETVVECDFYSRDDEIYMTINQLARALEYADKSGIEKLIKRNHYLTDKEFSGTDVLSVPQGNGYSKQETRLFTEDGIYEVSLLSGKPKARLFRAWVRKLIKAYRRSELPTNFVATHPDFLERCGVIPPALPEPSDKEVAIQFLQAIEAALESGEYYLLYKHCRKPEPQVGVLLGVYDNTELTLISSRTYALYTQRTGSTMRIQTLWEKLVNSGLVATRTTADRHRLVRGNPCCVIRVRLQAANAICRHSNLALLG